LFELLHAAYDDFDCPCVWFEEGLESLFGLVELEAMGD
jgi:hypothetical protein